MCQVHNVYHITHTHATYVYAYFCLLHIHMQIRPSSSNAISSTRPTIIRQIVYAIGYALVAIVLCSLSPFVVNGRQTEAPIHTSIDCQSALIGDHTAINISRSGDTNWQMMHTRSQCCTLLHQSNHWAAAVSMETCPRSMFEFDQNAYGSWSGPGPTCNNSAPDEGINGSFMLAFVGND